MSGNYSLYPNPTQTTGSVSANTIGFSIGTLDGLAATPNGASVSSSSIFMQTATATNPGLVSSFTQTFAGVKTFSNGWVSAGSVSMSSKTISNVLDPTTAQEAATKNYVDTQLAAFQPLEAVSLASIIDYPGLLVANVLTVTATGAISIDGSTPSANARVLLKDQGTGAQNGVYVVTTVGSVGVAPVLTRSSDYNTAAAVNSGVTIPVLSGAVNALTTWIQTATIVTLNTDSLVFTKYTSNPNNVPIQVGAINGAAASLNGAVIGSSTLYLQAASAANPGLVSSASQTFAGVKTFNSAPNLNSLSVSLPLQTDSAKNMVSLAIALPSQTTGSLSLTTQVVGTLPIANGGTNGITATAGFNNLVPITTAGDLIVGSASSVAVRFPSGLGGQVLKSGFTGIGGLSWDYAEGGVTAVKTANYTASSTDGTIICASSSFTVILPTSAGISGKVYKIKQTTQTSNTIVVATTGSQTFDGGVTATTLNTLNEVLAVQSDGSNWQIIERNFSSGPVTYTPTGTWVNAASTYFGKWSRVSNNEMGLSIRVAAGGAPTAASLQVSLPSGYQIDTAALNWGGNSVNSLTRVAILGSGIFDDNSGSAYPLIVGVAGTTTVLLGTFQNPVSGTVLGSTSLRAAVSDVIPVVVASSDMVYANFRVPILNWPV